MSLDEAHTKQMNKLDELIKTVKERKSAEFMELIVASIVGIFASRLFDVVYRTPIASWEDNVIRGFFFVIGLASMTAFLFFCAHWTDILHDIRNRKKKKP
jgi:hypothetical protein